MKNYIVEIVLLIDLRNDVIVVIDQLNLVEIFLKKKRKEHFFSQVKNAFDMKQNSIINLVLYVLLVNNR